MSSLWSSMKSMGKLALGSNKYQGKNNWDKKMGRFNDLKAVDIDGKDTDFKIFDGKVLLITNVACKCGYTKGSYDAMQQLALKYEEKGLRFLCFPCNQFMSQEPWTENEIKNWVTGKWPKLNPILFSKIEVNGDNTHPTYKFLKQCFPGDINWNFSTKFIVGKDGIPIQRFDKNQSWEDIEKCIQTALNAPFDDQQNEEEQKGNEDNEVNEDKNDKKLELETKSYVFKSIDDENKKITCLDADFNDIVFDLDASNKELLEKIEACVEKGKNEKKDVKIIVSSTNEEKMVPVISDVQIA